MAYLVDICSRGGIRVVRGRYNFMWVSIVSEAMVFSWNVTASQAQGETAAWNMEST